MIVPCAVDEEKIAVVTFTHEARALEDARTARVVRHVSREKTLQVERVEGVANDERE